MAIIDPEGYFGGDRFDLVTDEARMVWPSFFLASNSVGRIELNYFKIVARAFSRYRKPPAYGTVFGWLKEYSDAFLLFIYETGEGATWGQWNTSEKFLPRHKLTADRSSPAPDAEALNRWRYRYVELKRSKSNGATNFGNISQDSAGLRTGLQGEGVGEGVGVGVGVGVGLKASSPALPDEGLFDELSEELETRETQPKPENARNGTGRSHPPKPSAASLESLQESWFDDEFWPKYWRKVDKAEAKKSFKKHARTEAQKDRIVAAVVSHAPAYLGRDPEHRPHASTWLNRKRYDDDPEEVIERHDQEVFSAD